MTAATADWIGASGFVARFARVWMPRTAGTGRSARLVTSMTEHATDEEDSSPTKETTVSADIHEPEPEHFADVHLTVSGRMKFVDPDVTDRWITTDTVAEVTR